MSELAVDPTDQLLQRWNTETDFAKRNAILREMTEKGLFPDAAEQKVEAESGLYPDLPDPQAKLYNKRFLGKLLQKQEFIENRQEGIESLFSEGQDLLELLESDASACGEYKDGGEAAEPVVTAFELSPTQRFIGRFLSPKTPYNSALLFHGVGVGKTCSGITVAENFLEMFPKKQVFIVAPPTIQQGWLREIFNFRKLTIGAKDGIPNTHNGCTGNTYLRLSGTEYERDIEVIRKKVRDVVKRRYKIVGYLQFYNYVKKYLDRYISKDLSPEVYAQEERKYLTKRFSGGLIIVDEAHNLREKEMVVLEKKPTGAPPAAKTVVAAPPAAKTVVAASSNLPSEENIQRFIREMEEEEAARTEDREGEGEGNEVVFDEDDEDEVVFIDDVEGDEATNLPTNDQIQEFVKKAEEEANLPSSSQTEDEDEEMLAEIRRQKELLKTIEEDDEGDNYNEESNEEEDEVELFAQDGGAEENENDDYEDDESEVDEEEESDRKEEFVGEESDTQIPPEDKADILKGKKVTPMLRKILEVSEGMKFLMLTATPMYNEYKEIILLLNLMLVNDKKATVRESQIFLPNGGFAPGGRELLGRIANAYVSFMRGENPLSFPVRLSPLLSEDQKVLQWPSKQPDGKEVNLEERQQVINLPFVSCPIPPEATEEFRNLCTSIIQKNKLTIPTTDKLIMAGNYLYPGGEDLTQSIGRTGFQNCFSVQTKPLRFRPNEKIGADWMLLQDPNPNMASPIELYSPKAKYVLERLKSTRGVGFVYSRFVESGALTLALLLEANGYTCASRKPLLDISAPPDGKGRQCALCPRRESEHTEHNFEPKGFVPAQYVLLTGEKDLSPKNKEAIELATQPDNFDGKIVKVVLGSTIASEGIDLKFIREIFVFDSWYHLSKLEQVIGRGIRYKSHCALPPLQRNCTINLLVLTYPEEYNLETIDMYQYRNGFLKARLVGQVTRVLKEYAIDCNLNKELIVIQILNDKKHLMNQEDGQGNLRENIDINDTPYTNICDWLESCDYKCKPTIEFDDAAIDYSTYDQYAAKWREHDIKRKLRALFEQQPWRHFDDLENKILADIPRIAIASILQDIVGNKSFRIRVGDQEGYIIYKNGFYLFQPELLWDQNLPLALRISNFPVKRDMYEPIIYEEPVVQKPKPKPAPVAKNSGPATAAVAAVAAVAENVEVVEEDELPFSDKFWEDTVKWSNAILSGTAGEKTPPYIVEVLGKRYAKMGGSTITAVQSIFEMFGRINRTISQKEDLRRKLAEVLLEFVWDEYLSPSEIQRLFVGKPDSSAIRLASAENVGKLGSKTLFRFINPRDGKLVYMCDGKRCEQSIIDGFEEDDPLGKLKADKSTTGLIYGLNAVKDGKMQFKEADAVEVGKEAPIGRLCYNVSNIPKKIALLHRISEIAKKHLGTDLDLSEEKVSGVRTPARLCTLADLAFRLLDKGKVGGKRYFYRPIAARKTKHLGKGSK